MFGVACPHCGRVFAYDEKLEGQTVACTECGNKFLMSGSHIPPAPPVVTRATNADSSKPPIAVQPSRLPRRRDNSTAIIIAGGAAIALLLAALGFALTSDSNPSPTGSIAAPGSSTTTTDLAAVGLWVALILMAIAAGICIYVIPTIIAVTRNHQNAAAIIALNLLLGWSFLGWVAAFVWSLTETTTQEHRHYHYGGH